MKIQRIILGVGILICAVLLISGCKTLDTEEDEEAKLKPPPYYMITINEIVRYPTGSNIEKCITTFSGREIWINENPYISSKQIRKIKLIKRKDSPSKAVFGDEKPEGFYDLKLYLNRRGSLMWMQLSVSHKKTPVAFLIDGVFYRAFIPRKITSEREDIVVVPGPFDEVTARCLQKYAKANYKYFKDKNTNPLFEIFKTKKEEDE